MSNDGRLLKCIPKSILGSKVIVGESGVGDPGSNPGRDFLHFTLP